MNSNKKTLKRGIKENALIRILSDFKSVDYVFITRLYLFFVVFFIKISTKKITK